MSKTGGAKQRLEILKRKIVFDRLLPAAYRRGCKKAVDKKLVLFIYDRSADMPENFSAVKEELERRNDGWHFVIRLGKKSSGSALKRNLDRLRDLRQTAKLMASAGYIVLAEHYVPTSAVQHRPETTLIQLWHACGAFKKWGWSTLDSKWGVSREINERFPMHRYYDRVTVSSAGIIPCYAEALRTDPKKIFACGVPRTDVFFDPDFRSAAVKKFYNAVPIAQGKRVVLYAPTFRGGDLFHTYNEAILDFGLLRQAIGEDSVLILKLHPLVQSAFEIPAEYSSFAADVSQTMQIDEMLCAADVVISDYSSLIFEYALLNRPMVFFAYDLEQYVSDRDFYYKYEDMVPGRICKTNAELADALKNAEHDYDPVRMSRFREFFMSACDGHSTQRIVDKFFYNK